jgi:hypothetical protein
MYVSFQTIGCHARLQEGEAIEVSQIEGLINREEESRSEVTEARTGDPSPAPDPEGAIDLTLLRGAHRAPAEAVVQGRGLARVVVVRVPRMVEREGEDLRDPHPHLPPGLGPDPRTLMTPKPLVVTEMGKLTRKGARMPKKGELLSVVVGLSVDDTFTVLFRVGYDRPPLICEFNS